MPNAIDYLDWRGDIPLDFDGFNEVDGLIVSKLTSLDFTGIVPEDGSMRFADALGEYFKRFGEEDRRLGVLLPAGTVTMAKKLLASRRFAGLVISDYVNHVDDSAAEQFCALTARLPDGSRYAAFRPLDKGRAAFLLFGRGYAASLPSGSGRAAFLPSGSGYAAFLPSGSGYAALRPFGRICAAFASLPRRACRRAEVRFGNGRRPEGIRPGKGHEPAGGKPAGFCHRRSVRRFLLHGLLASFRWDTVRRIAGRGALRPHPPGAPPVWNSARREPGRTISSRGRTPRRTGRAECPRTAPCRTGERVIPRPRQCRAQKPPAGPRSRLLRPPPCRHSPAAA